MPTVPRRGAGYVPTRQTPSVSPGNAFQPPEPVDIGPAARQLAQIIERHKQRADEVALLEADNKLSELSSNLETQTLQKKGRDALDAGADVEDQWKKTSSEIEGSLTNDLQRENFRLRADRRWTALNATVQRHGASEFQKYDAEQTDVGLKARTEQAVKNYADPKLVDQSVSESKALVQLYGSRNGWSPEQVKDKQLSATTQLHAQVISRMLAEGNDILANDYYKKTKSEINSETGTQLEQHLEVASSEGQGLRAANEIWGKLGPKSLNDPVILSAMEQEAREKYADQPRVLKATIQELRSRRESHNADQVEVTASNKATVLGAFSKGASVASLTRSAAYLSLSGTEQEQLKSYMLASRRADANREPDKRNWTAYWGYSQPNRLAAMSENQILALVPGISQGLVNDLMRQKRALGKGDDKVRDATIDTELFNTIANDAGFNPYDKDTDKATLGRLKNNVESAIDLAQQAKGKGLTRDEKQQVMRGVIDQKVMLDRFGRSDPELPAATLSKDDRGIAYIPLERVPPQVRTEALNWMRSNGLTLPNENDAQLIARFQRRIEKAYAARITGATAAEIDAILRGSP